MIQERVKNLRAYMATQHADGVVILQPENLRYFSDFTGGEGALVVTHATAELWTDARYTEQAALQSGTVYAVKNHEGKLAAAISGSLAAAEQVLYEQQVLTHYMYEALAARSQGRFVGVDLTPLRAVKTPAEIAATRKACAIADAAFAKVLPRLHPGMTEREAAAQLECEMLLAGSEEKSFTTIVASGKRSAMPHGTATDKPLETGDFITFDFGAVWNGYHSDMTRTIVLGHASQEQKEFYRLVRESQQLGLSLIKPGMNCREADAEVRAFLTERGMGKYFTHSLGHGTGLEIHEAPILSPRSMATLRKNMIVTVEPGLYIEGKYGVRIEDSLAVTATGCEVLTQTSKELMELF